MDTQVADVDAPSIPSESGAPPVKAAAVGVWQISQPSRMNAPGAPIGFLGWFRQETDGTVTLISQNELRAWEKTQKGPAGEDLLRGRSEEHTSELQSHV